MVLASLQGLCVGVTCNVLAKLGMCLAHQSLSLKTDEKDTYEVWQVSCKPLTLTAQTSSQSLPFSPWQSASHSHPGPWLIRIIYVIIAYIY